MFRRTSTNWLRPRTLLMEQLEDRLLFDAVPDAAALAEEAQVEAQPVPEQTQAAIDQAPTQGTHELIIMDPRVANAEQLLQELLSGQTGRDFEVRYLNADQDGVEQITQLLAGSTTPYDAVHIFTHGQPGQIELGSTWLAPENLPQHAGEFARWGTHLSADADLLFYGCDVAQTATGVQMLEEISVLTGADVSASDDMTGNVSLGGDWDLEFQHGTQETATLEAPAWQGVLAPLLISASGLPTVTGTGGVGTVGLWTNAGTVGGVPIDLRATVISRTGASIVGFTTGGGSDDPRVTIDNAGTATIRWEVFQSGTGQTVVAIGDPNFKIRDLDGNLGVGASIEGAAADLTGLYAYTRNNPTNLVISNDGNQVRADGTLGQNATQQEAWVQYSWRNRSSWEATYFCFNASAGQRFYDHDGDGDFVFSSPVVVGIPQIDLDSNNSSGATGSNYLTSFIEGGSAVSISDMDILLEHASSSTLTGATIILTNAQASDLMTVGTLPGSISSSINTSVAGQVTVTLSGTATLAEYQTAIQAVSFSNNSDTPSTTPRNVTVRVTDGVNPSDIAVATIGVVAVDDAPTLNLDPSNASGGANDGNYVATYTENAAAVALMATNSTANDFGEADLNRLTVSVTGVLEAAAERIHVGSSVFTLNSDSTLTTVAVSGVAYNVTVAYTAATSTFEITRTGGGVISVSEMQTIMRSVAYSHTSENPTAGVRTVSFVSTDSAALTSVSVTTSLTVVPVNDAPIVDLNSAASVGDVTRDNAVTFTEGDATVNLTSAIAAVSDLGENDITLMNIVATGLADGALESLTIGGQSFALNTDATLSATLGGTTFAISYVAATGTFSIQNNAGAAIPMSAADLTTLVRSITYLNTDEAPSGSARSFSFTSTDSEGTVSNAAVANVTIIAVNDAPNATDNLVSISENAVVPVSGNVLTDNTGAGVDSDPENDVLNVVNVNATAVAGATTVTGTYGTLTVNANGSYSYTVNGSDPTVNALTTGQTVTETFVYTVTDLTVGPLTDTANLTITINGVNDVPVLNLDPNNITGGANDGNYVTTCSESTGPVSIDASPLANSSTIIDPDNTTLASLNLTVSGLIDGNREKLIIGGTTISLVSSSTQQVTVNGEQFDVDVTLSGTTATVIVTPGGAPLSAALTDFRDVLRSIEYQNTSVEATHGDRVISMTATDAGGATGTAVTSTIHVLNQFTAPSSVTGPEDQVGGISLGIVNTLATSPFTINLSGAPTGTTLSVGINLGGGLWSVPAASVGTLKVISPTNYSGNYNVSVANGLELETVAVIVTPVADTPILSTVDVVDYEDTVGVSLAGHISAVLADLDGSETLTLQITTVPPGFTLTDGTNTFTSPASGAVVTITSWNLGMLFLIPPPNQSGEVTLSLLATATESDGSTATNNDVITITINPVNDPPVFTDLVPSVTFTETLVNAGPQLIDIDVTVSDIDSPNFNGGSLVVGYSVGGGTEDSLSIRNQGTGSGQIGFNGTTVTFGGVVIGTISGGQNGTAGTPLVIDFNASATPAAVEALIQNLTYVNSSDTPAAARTIQVTIDDGGTENATASALTVINVTPVNDVPVLDMSTAIAGTGYVNTFTENGPAVSVTASTVLMSDPDDPNIESALVVLTNAQTGDLLTFASSLPGGITAIIDTAVPGIVTITLSGTATQADYQNALAALRFENTSDTPSTTPRVIDITVNDGSANSNTAISTISVVSTNDTPAIADLNGVTFTESAVNSGPQLVDISVTVTDTDSMNLNGGSLTISYDAMDGGSTDDQLSFMDFGTGPGLIGFSGTTITYGGVVIGTVRTGADGSNGSDLIIDFTANATPGAVDALLQSLTYANADDTPAATRTITAVVTDGDGGTSNTASSQITITAENDPPVITAVSTPTYTQDRPEVVVASTVTVSDVDDTFIESATVTISSIDRTNDLLTLTPAAQAAATLAGITVTAYNPATGELTLSGSASPADYQAVLAGIQFSSSSGTPTDRVISYVVNDGSDSSNVANVTVDYIADTIAPTKPVITAISDDTGPSSTDGFTSDNTLTISGTAEPNSTLELFLDGVSLGTVVVDGAGNWTFDHTGTTLADGPYVLTATSTDAADNTSVLSDPFAIVVDTNTGSGTLIQGPIVSAISIDSGSSGTDGVTSDNTLVISGTAQPNSSVEVFIDGVSIGTVMVNGAGLWSIDHTSATLPDETYDLTAVQTDPAGNMATSPVYEAVVDTDNPEPPVVTAISDDTGSSSTDAFTSDNTLIFSGNAEPNSEVEVFLDGVSIGTVMADGAGLWSLDYTATVLADGPYVLTATSTDDAGNVSDLSATYAFTVDTNTGTGPIAALPLISSMSDDTGVSATDEYTSDNTLEFSGTGQPNSVLELFLDGTSIGTTNIDAAGNWTFDYTSVVLPDGDYILTGVQTDLAGNVTSPSPDFAFTVDTDAVAGPHTTVPTVTAISIDSGSSSTDEYTNDNTLIFSGTADPNASIEVYLDGVSIGTTTTDSIGNWRFDNTTTVLLDGDYEVSVEQTDQAGNLSASTDLPFTIDTNAVDGPHAMVTPAVVSLATNITLPTLTGEYDSDDAVALSVTVNGVIYVLGTDPQLTTVGDTWTLNLSVGTVAGLPEGTYSVTTTATDLAGNSLTDVTSAELLVDLTAPAAPTIDGPIEGDDIINAAEDDDAAISGTGEPNTTLTLTVDDGNPLTPPVTIDVLVDAMGNWTVPVAGLNLSGLKDGPLTVTAFTTDASGNVSPTATAAPVHDTVNEPVVITGPVEGDDIVNAAEAGSVLVTGTAEPNSTVTVSISDGANPPVEVVVTTDPSGNWTIVGQEVDISGLNEGPLTITATAVDEAGNPSTSDTHDIVLDITAPSINPLDPDALTIDTPIEGDNTANAAEDNDVLLTGTAEPNSTVTLTVRDPSGHGVTVTVMTDPDGLWTITGDELDLSAFDQGTLDVSATATDLAGNTSAAVATTFEHDSLVGVTITGPVMGDDRIRDAEDNAVLVIGTTDPNASVEVTLTDATGKFVTVTVIADGAGLWSIAGQEVDLSTFDQGTITITAIATDTAGNVSTTATHPIDHDSIDPAPPTVNTLVTNDQTPTLTGTWDEASASELEVTVNGVTYVLGTNPQLTTDGSENWTLNLNSQPLLPGAVYDVSVVSNDEAGNTSNDSTASELTVDVAPPVRPTVNVLITNDVTPTITGTWAAGDATILQVVVNGFTYVRDLNNPAASDPQLVANSDGTWSLNLDGEPALNPGRYNVSASNWDPANNRSNDKTTNEVTIDVTPPLAAVNPPNLTTPTDTGISNTDDLTGNNTPTFSGKGGEPGSTATIYAQPVDENGDPTGPPVTIGTATTGPTGLYSVLTNPGNPLADGPYLITVTFTDRAGNESDPSPSLAIVVDTTAPVELLITDAATSTIEEDHVVNLAESPDVTIAGSGAEPSSTVSVVITDSLSNILGPIAATLNADGTWTIPDQDFSGLADGPITVVATETDNAGNVGLGVSTTLTLDRTPPLAPPVVDMTDETDSAGASVADDLTYDQTPTFTAPPGTGVAGDVVSIYVDGELVATGFVALDGSYEVTPTNPIAEGPHDVTASFTDPAGNEGPQSTILAIVIDITEPSLLAIDAPVMEDDLINAAEAPATVVSGSGVEPTSTVEVTFTDSLGASVGPVMATVNPDGTWTISPTDLTSLADGPITVTVIEEDAAGNLSEPVTSNITLDTTPPEAALIAPNLTDPTDTGVSNTDDNTANIAPTFDAPAGTGEPGSTVTLYVTPLDVNGDPIGSPLVVGTAIVNEDGSYTISVGPISPLGDGPYDVTVTFTDIAGNEGPQSPALAIIIDTTEPAAALIAPNLTDATDSGTSPTDDLTNVTTPTFDAPVETGEPGSTVTLYVTPLDADGEPTGPAVAVGTAIVNEDGSYTVRVDAMNPLVDGHYDVTVTFTDLAGNEGPQSPALAIVVDTTAPTTDPGAVDPLTIAPPIEGDDIVNAVEVDDVLVTGTAEPNSVVEVTLDDGNPLTDPVVATVTTDAAGNWTLLGSEVDLSTLDDGPLNVTATATDAAGNTSEPVTAEITKDTVAPAAALIAPNLTDPTDSGSSNTDDLTNVTTPTFDAPAGTGEPGSTVTLYVTPLDENGDPAGPPMAVGTAAVNEDGSYTVSVDPMNPLADGPYDITVTFTDPAGNEGAQSLALEIVVDTMAPAAAPVAPNLTDPTDTGSSPIDDLTNDTTPTFDAPAGTGEPGSTVTLYLDGERVGTATVNEDGSYEVSVDPDSSLADGPHDVTVTFTDPAGNESEPSPPLAIIVDTTDPNNLLITNADTSTIEGDHVVNLVESPDVTIAGSGAEPTSTVSVVITDSLGTELGPIAATVNEDGTWTIPDQDFSSLVDGPITVIATETDAAGNVGPGVSTTLILDTTSPVAPLLVDMTDGTDSGASPTDDLTNDQTPTFTAPAGTGVPGDLVTIYVDGELVATGTVAEDGSYEVTPTTPIAEGPHNVTASFTDPAGNEGPQSLVLSIEIDITPPSELAINPNPMVDGLVNADEAPNTVVSGSGVEPTSTVTVTFTDSEGHTVGPVMATVNDDGTWTSSPTDLTSLVDGSITITAVESDDAGNVGEPVVSELTLDTTPPTAAATPPNLVDSSDSGSSNTDDVTSDTTPTFNAPAGTGEPGSTVTLYIDGEPVGMALVNEDGSYTVDVPAVSPLTDGPHAVTVTFTDPAGNEGPPSPVLSIVVDTTAPIAAVIAPDLTNESDSGSYSTDDLTNDTTPTFSAPPGTGEPGSTVTLYVDGEPVGTALVNADGSYTVSLPPGSPLTDGPHEVAVSFTDPAGNEGPLSPALDFIVDSTAPDGLAIDGPVTSDNVVNLTETPLVALSGTGAEPGSIVSVTLTDSDGNNLGPIAANVNPDGTWTVPATDISSLADGPITVTATETDEAGNVGEPVTSAFDKDTTPPAALTPPNLVDESDSGSASEDDLTNDTTPTFNGPTGSGEPGSTVTLYVDGEPVGTAIVNEDGSYEVTVDPGSPLVDGPHDLTVTFTDTAGNEGPQSPTLVITLDTTAPDGLVISGPVTPDDVVNAAEQMGVVISGIGVEPTSTVTVTLTDSAGNEVGPVTAFVNEDGTWSIPPTDISSLIDGPITVTATETDKAGNAGDPVSSSFDKDTTPPQALTPPDLVDGSDTGDTPTDNLTNDNTPTFSGPAGAGEPGSTVTLYVDGEPVGTAIVNEDGSYSVDVPVSSPLSDGEHQVTVTFTDVAGNEGPHSPPLAITIDTTEPISPTTTLTLPDKLTGTGEPGTKITMLDKNGDPGVDTNGNPIVTMVGVDGKWTLTGMFPQLGFQDTVTVISTDGAGNSSSTSVKIAFFGFDSFNNLSQTPSRFMSEAWSDSEILLSRLLLDLGSSPILSGSARPGTQLIARLYSVDGSILAEQSVIADAAGNWMLQLPGMLPSDAPRIVIEHISTSQVPLGSSGFRLSDQTYTQLQFGTTYGYQSTADGVLGATAGEALRVDHAENLNPLNWL